MGRKISPITILLFTLLIIAVFSQGTFAFGAGNIPSYGYLEGKAYRHGDIEDYLAQLAMTVHAGGNLMNFFGGLTGGSKFSGLNVKRVYFGNWLRDYSQAVDVGTLGRGIKLGTIRVLVWVMGFMANGYATEEFEVTNERLGVYRPEEHIDNPKGYADGEDARKYDRRLRGPVDPRELEVDRRTGMKNYIANEQGGWSTSTRYIRESLLAAIQTKRNARDEAQEYEALRLLGQALHTLEDLSAHSNWVELALIEMGHRDIFPHVGDQTGIYLGGKHIYPLVTGTFGGMDFIHSLLGEATDHLSQTQISDVNTAVTSAAANQGGESPFTKLRQLLEKLPDHKSRDLTNEMHSLQQNSDWARSQNTRAGGFDLSQTGDVDPEEIAQKIYPILRFRDRVVKTISVTIEKIPGLEAIVEKITDSLTVWVLSLLEPFIKPIVQLVTKNLNAGSDLVVSDEAQYEVFDNPRASDPTHSMLSKDHFSCWLNDPAGQVAVVIVRHAVTEVVRAWSDPSVDPYQAINSIMRVFCHPSLLDRNCKVQMEMYETVEKWLNSLDGSDRSRMLQGLTKNGVRQGHHHDSKRLDAMGGYGATAPHGHSHGGGYGLGEYGGGQSHAPQQGGGFQGYINQAQQMIGGAFPGQQGGNGGFGGLSQNFQNLQNFAEQFTGGGRRREMDEGEETYGPPAQYSRPNPPYPLTPSVQQGQGYVPPPYPPDQPSFGGPHPYGDRPQHHQPRQPPYNQQAPYGGPPYP